MWRLPIAVAAVILAVLAIVAYEDAPVSRAQVSSPSVSLVKDETTGDGNPAGDVINKGVSATYNVAITTSGPPDTDVHLQIMGPLVCHPLWASPLDQHPSVLVGVQISQAHIQNVGASTVVAQYSVNCSSPGDYAFQITANVTSESVLVDPQPNDNQTENHVNAHVQCDADSDGICSPQDNCPTAPNANQANFDGDALGDACDPDDDNDAIPDAQDGCPLLAEDADGVQDSDGCPDTDVGVTVDKEESLTVQVGQHQMHPVSITVTNGNYPANVRLVILAVSHLNMCEVRLIPINPFEAANYYMEFATDENNDFVNETLYSQIELVLPNVPANSSLVINRNYDIVCYQGGFFPDGFEYQVDVLPLLPVVEENLGDDPRVPPDSPSNNVHKNFPDVTAQTASIQAFCASVTWPVPVGDSECDGFPDSLQVGARAAETKIGTSPASNCAATTAIGDEPGPDAWPPDFNDNQIVNGADILSFNSVFGKRTSDPPVVMLGNSIPVTRFDLNANGIVNGADVLQLNQFMSKRCTP